MKGEADGSMEGQRGNLRYLLELVEPGGKRPKEKERVFGVEWWEEVEGLRGRRACVCVTRW